MILIVGKGKGLWGRITCRYALHSYVATNDRTSDLKNHDIRSFVVSNVKVALLVCED